MDSGWPLEDADRALVRTDWQPILHGNNQVVLYNPTSKALTVTNTQNLNDPTWASEIIQDDVVVEDICPYCHRPLDVGLPDPPMEPPSPTYPRASNYFHLLAQSSSVSRPRTPSSTNGNEDEPTFSTGNMAEGYFDTFFKEEKKLGMGANGSVFLCQHLLDGNALGRFAVKKIAVGSSHDYLVKILDEVSPCGLLIWIFSEPCGSGSTSRKSSSSKHHHISPFVARNMSLLLVWPRCTYTVCSYAMGRRREVNDHPVLSSLTCGLTEYP